MERAVAERRAAIAAGCLSVRPARISGEWTSPRPAQGSIIVSMPGREATLKRILDGGIVAVVRSESGDLAGEGRAGAGRGRRRGGRGDLHRPRRHRRDPPGPPRGRRRHRARGRHGPRPRDRPRRAAGRRRVHRRPDAQPRGHPPLPPLRQGRHARRFTPTEILTAWEAGADVVKVFPADVGGPAYLKAIRGPLPQIRLMPTGGVDLQTAEAFLKAGACCLGVGSALVDPKAIAAGDFGRIRDLAAQYAAIVRRYRGRVIAGRWSSFLICNSCLSYGLPGIAGSGPRGRCGRLNRWQSHGFASRGTGSRVDKSADPGPAPVMVRS